MHSTGHAAPSASSRGPEDPWQTFPAAGRTPAFRTADASGDARDVVSHGRVSGCNHIGTLKTQFGAAKGDVFRYGFVPHRFGATVLCEWGMVA